MYIFAFYVKKTLFSKEKSIEISAESETRARDIIKESYGKVFSAKLDYISA